MPELGYLLHSLPCRQLRRRRHKPRKTGGCRRASGLVLITPVAGGECDQGLGEADHTASSAVGARGEFEATAGGCAGAGRATEDAADTGELWDSS